MGRRDLRPIGATSSLEALSSNGTPKGAQTKGLGAKRARAELARSERARPGLDLDSLDCAAQSGY